MCKGCSGLSGQVVIPNGIVEIGNNAFGRAFTWHTSQVFIPDSVETIDMAAFYDCRALRHISVGAGVRTLKPLAFKQFASQLLSTVCLGDYDAQIGLCDDWADMTSSNTRVLRSDDPACPTVTPATTTMTADGSGAL